MFAFRSAAFYERRREFLGERFLDAVEHTIAAIRKNPAIGRREKHEARSFRVGCDNKVHDREPYCHNSYGGRALTFFPMNWAMDG